jgi:Skp family chaperone for outer membrane proteins
MEITKEKYQKGCIMKSRFILVVCMLFVAVLFLSHQYTTAQTSKPALNIGIVIIEKAVRECKATTEYKKQLAAEDSAESAKLTKLTQEIQELTAVLKSGALIAGSSDYMTQYEDLQLKQSELETRKTTQSQKRTAKYQQWTQKVYEKILQTTKEVSDQKGLSLVLASEELQFPIEVYDELMTALATHKVLYSSGCVDITSDVIAKLDQDQQLIKSN